MLNTAQVLRRFSFDEWSGLENVLWNSVLGMREHNICSEILCTSALSGRNSEERDGIPIRRYPYYYPCWPLDDDDKHQLDRRGGNPVSVELYRALLEGKYDLLHVHSDGRIGQLVRAAARRKKIPYIVSFHSDYLHIPEEERREMEKPLRHTFSYGRLIELFHGWRRDFISDAAGIVCVGENEAGLLREKWPNKRILHLPNGVDPDRFSRPVKADIRKEFKIPPYRTILLCVSRIDDQKNQKLVLRLTSALVEEGENVHALLIGPPSTEYYLRELNALARQLQIGDRVTVVPGLGADDERLIAAYQDSDVFIMPSKDETFGIVVLEAWSAGTPVLASAVGGLKQLIRDGVNGLLFESDNLTSLLNAYRTLERGGLRDQLTANARREVVTRYSYGTVSNRLADFYRESIDECNA